VEGELECPVYGVLDELYGTKDLIHLERLELIERLLELGWIVPAGLGVLKEREPAGLELLHADIALSTPFLRLLEEGNLEPLLSEPKPYADQKDYLQDQFYRIELYQKIASARQSLRADAPTITRLRAELAHLESTIQKRLEATAEPIELERLFEEYGLEAKERVIFLALLKEEYAGGDSGARELGALADLVSESEYERIENRALLEEGARLVEEGLVEYEEIVTPFGSLGRSFYIPETILHRIIGAKNRSRRLSLRHLVREQDIFDLIEPKTSLEDVVLHPQTKERLETLVRQIDPQVAKRLKKWGIKQRRGPQARVIFYGPPGTGKTLTALSLARTLKRSVLSFDCSKILSMYVGESEKNVRKIFETFYDLRSRSRKEPVLLLNEADQFLGARSQAPSASAERMHNQMQNIFLEQIERFDGLLVATTNLLETIDPAFSRRFDYKIEFKKPGFAQRLELWRKFLPKNADFEEGFDLERLAAFELSGAQIELVVRNTALVVASRDEPIFTTDDFVAQIRKELGGAFGEPRSVGFGR
jgi:SpoVK/Ycf46/Vps4 family AAA+-type ATPase